MKRAFALAVVLLPIVGAYAAEKTYQVTGPVLEVRPDAVVVQKDKEKWEIARGANTNVKGELKEGSKVTIKYTMAATDIEVKDDQKKADKPAKKK